MIQTQIEDVSPKKMQRRLDAMMAQPVTPAPTPAKSAAPKSAEKSAKSPAKSPRRRSKK
jgi:hypothetical protein